jgi:hypothetical protein
MNSITLEIILGLIALIGVSISFYKHYKVKDGIGRMMLLWGCGLLLLFVALRTIGYVLFGAGVIDLATQQVMNQINFTFIYAIIFGQLTIQYLYQEEPRKEHPPVKLAPFKLWNVLLFAILILVVAGRIYDLFFSK